MSENTTGSSILRKSTALQRLQRSLAAGASTQLGIGPMSKNCVDAVVELANTSRVPLMLIASRRQIDSAEEGGGYVNNWSTEEFASYVRQRDRGGYVVLCRDHGGPWQSAREVTDGLQLAEAMKSAKESYLVDIASGFDIIHIDPSIDIHEPRLSQDAILDRLFDLYTFCMETSAAVGTGIAVEIGSEEQSGVDQDLAVLTQALRETQAFCKRNAFPPPLFVVAQTGTLVKETKNIGTFDDPFRKNGAIPAEILVPRLIEMCYGHGVCLKEHNGDYLSNEALLWHPRLRIHATNIAPEFGVAETRHLVHLLSECEMKEQLAKFLEVSFTSKKWEKWMLPNSQATDCDRAIIAGHYVFSDPQLEDVFGALRRECRIRGIDLEASIRDAIKLSIMRIMACFNLYRH